MALGVRAMAEAEDFQRDMHQYDSMLREADGGDPREDQVVLRRLALAQHDPVRNANVGAAVRAAASALAARSGGSLDPLLAACEAYDPEVKLKVQQVLLGGGGAGGGGAGGEAMT